MSTIPPNWSDLIESTVSGNKNDQRVLLQTLAEQLTRVQGAVGQTSGTNSANVAKPSSAALSVKGANGAFNLTVANPSTATAPLWHQVRYSPVKGMTSGVTTLEPTTSTNMTINAPGETHFFEIRSSHNKQVWNDYQSASNTPVSSGLVSSAAISNGGAFNQTNYGVVKSQSSESAFAVNISGAAGALTSYPAVKGGKETILPPATVVGLSEGTNVFASYDGHDYHLHPTLATALNDNETPIGSVAVGSQTTGGGGTAGGNGGRMTNV